nr:hypothetical protein [Tanacetum cinerariifolium]
MQRKKNDVKARTTLLLSPPDEHQLRFSKYKTVKELWAMILKTFGGNEATKKRKKNLLKQNDLDTMSLDDLYNHLKVYEAEVQKKSNLNSHNMAFISSSKHSSGDEDGNTACVSTSSTTFPTASASVATISQDTASAYIASQSNGSRIKFEDINQIDKDDMEEMDIKCSMTLLSIRADKFWKRTGKKISIQGSDVAGFDKSKVVCFNCHKMGHFARECRAPRSLERGRKDNYRQGSKGEDHALVADAMAPTEFALMANTESNLFDNSLCSNDCRLVEYKEREVKYIEKIRTLEMYKESNLKCIETLDKELETLKLEKDGLDGKLAGLLKASKNLDNLIESQRPSPTVASTSAEGQNENSTTFEDVASPNTPKPFVKFVKPKDSQSESPEFVLKKKACFNCGDFSHFANECRKRVQRETTRSAGHRPHGASMRPSHRPTGHRPHGPLINPMRPNMNGARPNRSFFIQSHSYETRSFLKSSAMKTQYRALWVPTVNRNNHPVNRKFSTGRRNFPTVNRKFPTASRKFTTGSTKFTLLIWKGREKLAVPRTTLMTKAIGTVAALGT